MAAETIPRTLEMKQKDLASNEHSSTSNDGKTRSASLSLRVWMYRNLIHNTVTFVNIPFHTIAIWIVIYIALLWLAEVLHQSWLKALLLGYLAFSVLDPSPSRGGYVWWSEEWMEWLRNCWVCRMFAQYFPIHLIKTADIPAMTSTKDVHSNSPRDIIQKHQSYLFLYHPHGVISIGALGGLITNGCNFSKAFPGLGRRRGVTLNVCFAVPFYREWMLLLGMVSANKTTLKKVLHRGESLLLVPGGAAEALYAQPRRFRLNLRKRKGFIKLAMETGSPVVPVLGFGENNSFSVHVPTDESFLARLLDWMYRALTFAVPVLMSPFPQRNPIHVVVGKPVKFEDAKMSVDEAHALYVQALSSLYHEHKSKYGHENIPLEIH
mmetsp:Transcript_21951/g.61046  ORF Transcript_21951/g.61046 Transcript_21951/m.61046 type:complete len:379 (-) Transcript_21951:66-1202(-)